MSKIRRIDETHFRIEEEEPLSLSLPQNPLKIWEKNIKLEL